MREPSRVLGASVKKLGEAGFLDKSDVLDEHREKASHQEDSNASRFEATCFDRLRYLGQLPGNLSRYFRRLLCRVERLRRFPDIV